MRVQEEGQENYKEMPYAREEDRARLPFLIEI